jgi:hypothetical protein
MIKSANRDTIFNILVMQMELNMNSKLIVIDGKTYNSVGEMPPDVRTKYEQAMRSIKDADQNGMPDTFDNINVLGDRGGNGIPDIFENLSSTQITSNSMKFIVNGKEFNALEDLPPEARAKYEKAMRAMNKNRNGIPDFVEGMVEKAQQTSSPQNAPVLAPPRPSKPINTSPTISPDTSNGWGLVLAGGLLLLVCALGAYGVWFFLLK